MDPKEKITIHDASIRTERPAAPKKTTEMSSRKPSENGQTEKNPRSRRRSPSRQPSGNSPTIPKKKKNSPQEPEKTGKPQPTKTIPAPNASHQSPQPTTSRRSHARKSHAELHIAFLGGINEVGKNITCYECKGDRMLVDCGLAFPDAETPGIDLIIPDFSWIETNRESIKGIVITHGHEDHIGALPYLLKRINIPIYGTKLTLGLIKGKLKEHRLLDRAHLHEFRPGDTINLGEFSVEAIHVNHSIPDAIALAITTEAGVVIQTGDFKIDTTPIGGEMIDLLRFAEYGKNGVLALLSDSTNAERPGYTMSESKVGESFDNLFRRAGNQRLLVATFSSNVHRVQQIIDAADQLGRKVALIGRSLENVVNVGMELGYLHVPEGLLIPIDLINRYPADQLVIITTGSQGEPLSALTRMAFSDHRKVEISPNDCVIISATPIPGNEKTVSRVVNELLKLGANVIYEKMYDVHVSGHACQEELKIILGLVRPKYFIPVHGEQRHLIKHAQLAQNMGISPENIMLVDNGIQLKLSERSMKVVDSVNSGSIYVDGYGVGDVGLAVIRDRKHLAQEGMIIVAVCVDRESGQLLSGVEIISRGFVYVKESENLIQHARTAAMRVLEGCSRSTRNDWNAVRGKLKEEVSRLMYERTRRSPIVLPILLEN